MTGFLATIIDTFRLTSPNPRLYVLFGTVSLLFGTWFATYYSGGFRSLEWFGGRKRTAKNVPPAASQTKATMMPSPAQTPTTATTTSTSTSTATTTPPSTQTSATAPKTAPTQTSAAAKPISKAEQPLPSSKDKGKIVPPTPSNTPSDSPLEIKKVVSIPPQTTTSSASSSASKNTSTGTVTATANQTIKKTTQTEIEVKQKEVPVKESKKLFVVETEPEDVTKTRAPVIQEVHRPVEVEEIQPVVHRDRIQKEVHQVIQPYHEEVVRAPKVIEREAIPEHRNAKYANTEAYQKKFEENLKEAVPAEEYEEASKVTIYKEPIVEEVVKKEIIHVVQPVIKREIVEPTIVKTTQDIFEEVHEQPSIVKEELPVLELGVKSEMQTSEKRKLEKIEVVKKVHTEIDTEVKTTKDMQGEAKISKEKLSVATK